MLHFLVMDQARHQLQKYLRHWGGELASRVSLLAYEELPPPERLPAGVYVFCDRDRYPPPLHEVALAAWAELSSRGEGVRLLNDPARVMGRVELLRDLHRRGVNRFAVHEIDADPAAVRFPVFVRRSREHTGALSPLINNKRDLRRTIGELRKGGLRPKQLLIVEFLDTLCDGVFRKYAATRVGERTFAHHILFKDKWEVKAPSLVSPAFVAEEAAYQADDPYRDQVSEVFDRAGIDYGRMDFALVDGRIQVWEINTNPTLLDSPSVYAPEQMPGRLHLVRQLNGAFFALEGATAATPRAAAR